MSRPARASDRRLRRGRVVDGRRLVHEPELGLRIGIGDNKREILVRGPLVCRERRRRDVGARHPDPEGTLMPSGRYTLSTLLRGSAVPSGTERPVAEDVALVGAPAGRHHQVEVVDVGARPDHAGSVGPRECDLDRPDVSQPRTSAGRSPPSRAGPVSPGRGTRAGVVEHRADVDPTPPLVVVRPECDGVALPVRVRAARDVGRGVHQDGLGHGGDGAAPSWVRRTTRGSARPPPTRGGRPATCRRTARRKDSPRERPGCRPKLPV